MARVAAPYFACMAAATGLLVGTVLFLASKITNPPPLDPMAVHFHHLMGTAMPPLPTTDAGAPSSLPEAGERLIVLLRAPCRGCEAIRASAQEAAHVLPVVLVGTGEREGFAAEADSFCLPWPAIFDSAGALAEAVGISASPAAILVDQAGNIADVGAGATYARRLLHRTRTHSWEVRLWQRL